MEVTPQPSMTAGAPVEGVKSTGQAKLTTQVVEPNVDTANKPDPKLAAQFAALAKKEKAIRAMAQQIKAQQDALKAKEDQYTTGYIQKDRLTKDTLGVLAELGITQDQLAQAILSAPQNQTNDMQKLLARIDELEGKTTKVQQAFEEEKTNAYTQAVKQIDNEVKLLIDSDPYYETIKHYGHQAAVTKYIEQTFKDEGVILGVEEAAKFIEDQLHEGAMGAASLNKVKSKLAPAEQALQQQQIPKQQQITTLTNAQSASSKPLSAKERAILAFQGKLK